ncbi:MAG: hypothetical protein IIA03_16190 [Proteobacteria bacterium]|jgi:hypothetical protein|uniref:Uncharacterized protein n=1 Tax=Roseateles puraquae TaxID=431059 RepID=A0A254N0J6_9BURK|nr:hypothetical protein [Roseateles puraquae]MCH8857725.1 hypothetical protein [Pseudomonadota bacterium]MDG0857368.1 hypothetical protein [Roseateles puraquae]OWR01811.1 hypothetical protein CDO81_22570 [Roseateles puraquae]
MTLDAHLPHPSALEAIALPAAQWMMPAPPARIIVVPSLPEAELGYESALPWTLGDELAPTGY